MIAYIGPTRSATATETSTLSPAGPLLRPGTADSCKRDGRVRRSGEAAGVELDRAGDDAGDLRRVGQPDSGRIADAASGSWSRSDADESHPALIWTGDNRAVRVLVAEDEPKMGLLLKRGFGEEGHEADVVPTGEEALSIANTRRYDAIVLDAMLPGLDGFATCRELRSRGVGTPVLLLTARGRGRGPHRRARHRRRRLPREALLVRRAAGAPARAGPPHAGRATDDTADWRSAPRLEEPIVRHGPLPATRCVDLIAAAEASCLRGPIVDPAPIGPSSSSTPVGRSRPARPSPS